MSNTTLTSDIIAKEALVVLENELGFVGTLYRAPEEEFEKKVNGYEVGETVSIRRPADFKVRRGATMDVQDVIEGKIPLTVDQQIGVDFKFSSADLTLKISDLSERVIKPALTNVISEMAADCLDNFLPYVYNYVGTPNTAVDSFTDFYRAAERMAYMNVPTDNRYALMNPTDHAALLGNLTTQFIDKANSAYSKGVLGTVGGIDILQTQIVPPQEYGTADNTTPLTDGNSQEVTYDSVKNTWQQTLLTDGWDASATIKKGQVFNIDGVYMVDAKTKRSTGILQDFVAMENVTANGTPSNNTDFLISPPIIVDGPHQTVTYSGNFDGKAITLKGTASQTYRQNVAYHKNAMALAIVPMVKPPGAVDVARRTYKGISVRVIPVYDGVNDVAKWRLDLLYGRKLIDPRVAVRFSG